MGTGKTGSSTWQVRHVQSWKEDFPGASSTGTSHYLGLTELGRFRPIGNLSSCSLGWDDSVLQRQFYNRQWYTLNPASDPDLENRLGKKGTVFFFFLHSISLHSLNLRVSPEGFPSFAVSTGQLFKDDTGLAISPKEKTSSSEITVSP